MFTILRYRSGVVEPWIVELAQSAWLLPLLFVLVVADAFVVALPSETLVVALGVLSAATGSPPLWALLPVAAIGAWVGDTCCYWIGRSVGHDRWAWQGRGRLGSSLASARDAVLSRTALLIFTARYIPFARIAVNLSAGAAGVPFRRFAPLSAVAGLGWALYNTLIGVVFGTVFATTPLLAVVLSVAVAMTVGFSIDAISRRWSARRAQPAD